MKHSKDEAGEAVKRCGACALGQHAHCTKRRPKYEPCACRCDRSWQPRRQSYSAGFDDAARVSRVLNQVAATPTPVEQERSLSDVLHDAGAVLCRSAPDVGASVEIRFANLLDAQRLHKALVSIREAWTATPSPSVREAAARTAKEVVNELLNVPRFIRNPESTIIELENKVAEIIERHCSPVYAAGGDEEREFLAASVAVWCEIDKGGPPLDSSVQLRKRERAAWERYRATLCTVADSVGEEGK